MKLTLEQRRQKNLEIYTTLMECKDGHRHDVDYGSSRSGNFGEFAIQDIIETGSEFVVDIGCGRNLVISKLKEYDIAGIGIDIANQFADVIAPAHKTTLDDNVATHITSFDMLEHLEPDGVSEVLIEWNRIAKPGCLYIFSIATWCDKPKGMARKKKWQLHPTVWESEKWQSVLKEHGFHVDKVVLDDVTPLTGYWPVPKIRLNVWGTINI